MNVDGVLNLPLICFTIRTSVNESRKGNKKGRLVISIEVLRKYKVNGNNITNIKQFNPVYEEIADDNKDLKRCMKEIILRLSNLETIQDSTNEATRCVFITSILNVSIAITRNLTNNEKIYIAYQDDVSGEDSSGRVDYSIKRYEDLICIAEGKPCNVEIGYLQNIKQLEKKLDSSHIIESIYGIKKNSQFSCKPPTHMLHDKNKRKRISKRQQEG
ncbi:hypothetical protein Glove_566g46 [Diversispora epigaea]|uniref:Uncharacterized protein n=1 Tax=Diversispora epigaea TaxID=1348612 RepID=A0A397GCL7_9GLOM|nr:hypothetical protein Glove_566g46 [Diversispora epigaea]